MMPGQDVLEARLYLEQNMSEVETHAVADGIAAVVTIRSPDKTSANEDAAGLFRADEHSGVLAVADGMGGGRAGELAAELAVTALAESLNTSDEQAVLRTAILNGVESANQNVQNLGVGAATTLAVVEVQRRMVRPYHVGDSLILVTGQRSKIKLQTVSHSPVGFAVEAGVLDEIEAMHHVDRHMVSNMVGMPNMRIEVGSAMELAPRDTLLIASDGLSDNLHLEEIVEIIRKGPIQEAVGRLATEAIHRMLSPAESQPSKPDDLTILAYRPTRPRQRRRRRSSGLILPQAAEMPA